MKHIQLSILILLLLSITTACQPTLKRFQPESDSLFKITFSYPSSWTWEEYIPYDEIFPGDYLPPSERICSRTGLCIQVYQPLNPSDYMQELIDGYLEAVTTMLVSNTEIQIDGYSARWIIVNYPPEFSSAGKSHTSETIYFSTENQLYIIDMITGYSGLDGPGKKQFEDLVSSIRVLR